MGLCKYKDMFGAPDTGLHKYRFCGVAIVDVVMTLVGGWLIWRFVTRGRFSLGATTATLFVLGFALHAAFCVPTAFNEWVYSWFR
jgi:hypothetical protein